MYSLIVFTARQMIAVHGSIFLSGSAEHGTWLIACKINNPPSEDPLMEPSFDGLFSYYCSLPTT